MKQYIKNLWLLMIPLLVLGSLITSCETEDEIVGEPAIHYVRVTDPDASDSLLVAGSLGNLVAIMGENLGSVRHLWFNDQKAALEPTYITNTSILTNIPNRPPNVKTDIMTLVFNNGDTLKYPFEVAIGAPIANLQSAYALDGEELIIEGDFFFEPITVTFAGGTEAEIVSLDQTEIVVIVPEGVTPGPLTVTTNFGTAETANHFRENRYVFADLNGDPAPEGWWHGQQYTVAKDAVIPNIDGGFIRIEQDFADGQWFEMLVGPANSNMATHNIPDDAIVNPSLYNLQFEINTLEPFLAGTNMKLYIGNDMAGERASLFYEWKPALHTEGEWQTVTIPLESILNITKPSVNPEGYGVSFWFQGGVPMVADFAVDNFRVTPK